MNYYERHIGDYIRDTAHLSLLEHGIYNRLIDTYYLREGPIPDAEAERLIGARSPAEKKATRAVLAEFFELRDGKWYQSRCEEELAAYRELRARQSRRGKAGASARWGRQAVQEGCNTDASSMPQASQRNASSMPEACDKHPASNANAMLGDGLPSPISHKKYSVRANPADSPSLDAVLFAEARKVFGTSIGGQINRAIKAKGKGWVMDMIETCRSKDPEAARAYLAAALKEPERKVVV